MKKPIRVIVARLGMDAHWRGSIVVARALRDAGMEVVYLENQNPEAIAETAVQEAADVVGLSTLSGNHMVLAPEVVDLLRGKGMAKVPVVLGGTVTLDDRPALKAARIAEVFGPGLRSEGSSAASPGAPERGDLGSDSPEDSPMIPLPAFRPRTAGAPGAVGWVRRSATQHHRIVASPKEPLRSRFAQPNLPVIVWCRPYCLAAPQEKETPP